MSGSAQLEHEQAAQYLHDQILRVSQLNERHFAVFYASELDGFYCVFLPPDAGQKPPEPVPILLPANRKAGTTIASVKRQICSTLYRVAASVAPYEPLAANRLREEVDRLEGLQKNAVAPVDDSSTLPKDCTTGSLEPVILDAWLRGSPPALVSLRAFHDECRRQIEYDPQITLQKYWKLVRVAVEAGIRVPTEELRQFCWIFGGLSVKSDRPK